MSLCCVEIDEEQIYNDLPFRIRGEVASILTKDMMEKSPVFNSLSEHERKAVAGETLLSPSPEVSVYLAILKTLVRNRLLNELC